MLTDTKLKALKPKEKMYKVTDRDGLYAVVRPTGRIVFRYDYRINGRRETVTFGHYGPDGISLAEARDRLVAARKLVNDGISPAIEKQTKKTQLKGPGTVTEFVQQYIDDAPIVGSTRALRQATLDREIRPTLGGRFMGEVTTQQVRALCEKIKDRGAPSTALLVRELLNATYRYAINKGHRLTNPVETITGSSIATFKPRERALSPREIGIFFSALDNMQSDFALRKALRLILYTLVRKGEIVNARWDEVDYHNQVWTIPAERMKAGRAHNVYLSRQAMDIVVAFQMYSEGSEYLLPGRMNRKKPIAHSSLNRVIYKTLEQINKDGRVMDDFTVHDLRRTASTLLHEAGYNSDWIEKCLAHENGGIRAVYNKAEYAAQRRDMLQAWADMVDGWIYEFGT
jgi:putative integrase P4